MRFLGLPTDLGVRPGEGITDTNAQVPPVKVWLLFKVFFSFPNVALRGLGLQVFGFPRDPWVVGEDGGDMITQASLAQFYS